MKTIVVLMDSLNRRFLNIYGNDWVKTPNIDKFAEKSIVFTNHWIGSTPCMPARRDMMTGRLNFLEKNWGAIEPFDITLPEMLRSNDVFTHMITDHYHYFEIGGENYCQLFNTWDLKRGQESDPWVSRVDQPELPAEYFGKAREQYELNRTRFNNEKDYSGPRTFKAACDWLDDNHNEDDYLLWVEAFDPHEPFDCPEEFLEIYNDNYDGPRYEWSGYEEIDEPEEATEHLRKKYAALLTMTDKWFGKLLNVLTKYNMWEDTMIILTTDHGHMLGEHNFTGKNFMHMYNELAHIPLIVHIPGSKNAGKKVNKLTQNIDLMPTILDYYDLLIPDTVKGESWRGLITGEKDKIREFALYGYWGKTINITDGNYTYFRVPEKADNKPLYKYSAMPTQLHRYWPREALEEAEMGRYLKWTDIPVYRVEDGPDKSQYHSENLLFNIKDDYEQQVPLKDSDIEEKFLINMKKEMQLAEAPDEQYIRMGLKKKGDY